MEAESWSYDANRSLYDTLLEVWALEEYLKMLESELPRVVENERQRIHQDLDSGDEQAVHNAEIAEYQLDEGVTTRLITGSALVATWATFESAVKRSGAALGIKSQKILGLVNAVFERLGIRHHPTLIKDLYGLRNTMAHANGTLNKISPILSKKIRANSIPGLKVSHDGYLIVSIEFVVRAFKTIQTLLLDLAEQTDKELTST